MHTYLKPLLILTTAALAACGSSSNDDSGEGTLSVRLIDAPVEDVAEVWVSFDGVSVKRDEDETFTEFLFDTPTQVDLLTLVDGQSETLLANETLPSGVYTQMRLLVNAEFDGVFDSYVMTDQGEQIELRVPSGAQTGLKLNNDIAITDNQNAAFTLDWDVRQGLTNPNGQPGYFLKPTIRVIADTDIVTVSGTVAEAMVTDESCSNDLVADEGNAVYVFAGLETAPTDIAGLETDPVATVAVSQTIDGAYAYETILTPGDYTVAFTCQASLDNPEVDESTFVAEGATDPTPIVFTTNDASSVSLEAGASVIVDF